MFLFLSGFLSGPERTILIRINTRAKVGLVLVIMLVLSVRLMLFIMLLIKG